MPAPQTHGMSETRVYSVWLDMLYRCRSPKAKSYKNYGGRGIKVCKRWLNFLNFYEDMGNPPPRMSIERVNNNGDYSPSNCVWANKTTQNRNARNNRMIETPFGKMCVSEAHSRYGKLTYAAALIRISRGMNAWEALTTPDMRNASSATRNGCTTRVAQHVALRAAGVPKGRPRQKIRAI